jgi:large subunit ribosomal protein L23
VSNRASKKQIQEAIERIFKVKVQHVRTMNVPGKMRRRGRFMGYRPDWKKAYVTLREGEKMIEYGENF